MLKSLFSDLFGPGAARVAGATASDELEQAVQLLRQNDEAGAAQICERLLQRDPKLVKAWELLGVAALNLGDSELARERFEKVLLLAGENAQHLANAAEANRQADRSARALELIERALALQPGHAPFLHIQVLALEGCWRIDEALVACRDALVLQPDFARLHTSYMQLLNYAGADPALVLEAHCDWARRFAATQSAGLPHGNSPQPGRALRIGYVSADFRQHAASHFILPLLEHHDHTQFEVYCYSNTQKTDGISRRHEELASHWRDIATTTDEAADALLRAERIDILVDLSGHTRGNRLRLFARKPVPVQFTYLGYPGTTGLTQIDYRLTDSLADPTGTSASRYRERLVRLPHSLWCFQPPAGMPEPGPAPNLGSGRITFGSFNSMFKLNPRMVALWARLLHSLSDAKLILATVAEGEPRRRIAREFELNGIDPARLEFHGFLPWKAFWDLHSRVDLALDSHPCNGGATTCETLWLGVPLVSLAGPVFQSRAGLSILSNIGLPELVAHTEDEYLRIAVDLAHDPQRLAQMRSGMRSRMRAATLLDAATFTRDLEAIYRSAWKKWCVQQSGASDPGNENGVKF